MPPEIRADWPICDWHVADRRGHGTFELMAMKAAGANPEPN